jgi:putative ABC transport system permease protein
VYSKFAELQQIQEEQMFLAIREIKKEKLRYGLILTVVVLISYLIFILSALALGLATANTAAVDSWQSKSFVMAKDAKNVFGYFDIRFDFS